MCLNRNDTKKVVLLGQLFEAVYCHSFRTSLRVMKGTCRLVLVALLVVLGAHHGVSKKSIYPDNPSSLFYSKVFPFKHIKERGWGIPPNISWYPGIENGLAAAKASKKPVMILISNSKCHACENLKWQFVKSTIIWELSKRFTMVHCQNGEEPDDYKYSPDGAYHPRILFGDYKGNLDLDIQNRFELHDPDRKYFYYLTTDIELGMRAYMDKHRLK